MESMFSELLDPEELRQALDKYNSKKIVFTNGCFDLLHPGHVTYLAQARSLGDLLVVGLDTDASVRSLKGDSRPILPESARAKNLTALRSVDYVCFFSNGDPEPLIKIVKPDVLVKGGDWSPEQIRGSEFVLSYGGEVKSLSFIEGFSTTSIVEKIQSF